MNKLTLEQLSRNLEGWRDQRGMKENSTAEAQHNCYLEELTEFKDAIGDMVVCLINEEAMLWHEGRGENYEQCRNIVCEIELICDQFGIDFEECLSMAWNEIKDRVGMFRSTGKYTKWKDLTHEERLNVATCGQLYKKPKEVLDECFKHCTAEEWAEIEAAMNS